MLSDLDPTAEFDEERRQLYVAITRAKDDLHLLVPQRLFVHGENSKGRSARLRASRTPFTPEKLLASSSDLVGP